MGPTDNGTKYIADFLLWNYKTEACQQNMMNYIFCFYNQSLSVIQAANLLFQNKIQIKQQEIQHTVL